MNAKPVTPLIHGILDYKLGAALMIVPAMMGVPKRTRRFYQGVGVAMTALNAVTDTGVAIKPLISFKDHQKADLGLLAGTALYSFSKQVRRNKKAACFHFSFLAIALLHYVLTDYDSTEGGEFAASL